MYRDAGCSPVWVTDHNRVTRDDLNDRTFLAIPGSVQSVAGRQARERGKRSDKTFNWNEALCYRIYGEEEAFQRHGSE